jgi:hypothetical protein
MYVSSGTPVWLAIKIKDGSTVLNLGYVSPSGSGTSDTVFTHSWVGQLTGTKTITTTATTGTSGATILGRSATQFAYLLIEDIGPA